MGKVIKNSLLFILHSSFFLYLCRHILAFNISLTQKHDNSMKKRLEFLFVLLFLILGLCQGQNNIIVTPAGKMERAVSGHFAGIVDDQLTTWGGCNFPDVPCADGGQKVFYPKAYGASVVVPSETIYIGGMDENGSDASVSPSNLPPLPKPLDNFAACYGMDRIFVAGGQTNDVLNRDVYALDWPDGKEWVKIATLPDEGRLQPCMAVQNAPEGKALYVFGGWTPQPSLGGVVNTKGLKLNLKTFEWQETSSSTINASPYKGEVGRGSGSVALVGSCCTPCGYSHILFFGGVNYDIFLSAIQGKQDDQYLRHEPSWYKFRSDVLAYHTITDSWMSIPGDTALARAGAALTPFDGGWYYSGGETMPGIRSDKISRIETKHETHFGWLNWTVLILYLVAMLGMGIYFMRRENGAEDFFKGGGRVPWWAAGISIYATMLSAITYMAIPAKAYATDWTYYPMLWMIPVVGFPVIWYYLPYFRRLKAASAYAILEERFNLATRMMASTLFCIFMVARMALVMYLPSLALTAVTGIDIYLCIILMGLVTIVYCTMGGVEAVIWGDVVQGCILVGGAIFAALYLWGNTEGGFSGAWQLAVDNDKMRLFVWSLVHDHEGREERRPQHPGERLHERLHLRRLLLHRHRSLHVLQDAPPEPRHHDAARRRHLPVLHDEPDARRHSRTADCRHLCRHDEHDIEQHQLRLDSLQRRFHPAVPSLNQGRNTSSCCPLDVYRQRTDGPRNRLADGHMGHRLATRLLQHHPRTADERSRRPLRDGSLLPAHQRTSRPDRLHRRRTGRLPHVPLHRRQLLPLRSNRDCHKCYCGLVHIIPNEKIIKTK